MGKATFVRLNNYDVKAAAGIPKDMIDEGKNARYEFGGGMVFNFRGSYYSKRITYSSQLELFSNYFDKPQNLDVAWDFQFRIALNKYVSSGIRLNMMYYDSQKTIVTKELPDGSKIKEVRGAKLQMKQFFEIGLFYDLNNIRLPKKG